HLPEIAKHDLPYALGVQSLTEPCRAGHVAKEHRREFSSFESDRFERRSTSGAEAGVLDTLPPALRAPSHSQRLRLRLPNFYGVAAEDPQRVALQPCERRSGRCVRTSSPPSKPRAREATLETCQ